MKIGIVLAAFGSSNPAARRVLESFTHRVQAAFPGVPARWAFTSGKVRSILAEEEGKKTDSVAKALQKMRFEKYGRVAVQSLHVVPGAEFDALSREVAGEAEGFAAVAVGRPLLSTPQDAEQAARAAVRSLPESRAANEPVVFMGHGTWHAGDERYERLAALLQKQDPNLHIATMDGARTIEDVLDRLPAAGASPLRVWLVPLLAVPGRHVEKDMAGPDDNSWVNRVAAAGYAPRPVHKGAAEYDAFAAIWLDHLTAAVNELPGYPR